MKLDMQLGVEDTEEIVQVLEASRSAILSDFERSGRTVNISNAEDKLHSDSIRTSLRSGAVVASSSACLR